MEAPEDVVVRLDTNQEQRAAMVKGEMWAFALCSLLLGPFCPCYWVCCCTLLHQARHERAYITKSGLHVQMEEGLCCECCVSTSPRTMRFEEMEMVATADYPDNPIQTRCCGGVDWCSPLRGVCIPAVDNLHNVCVVRTTSPVSRAMDVITLQMANGADVAQQLEAMRDRIRASERVDWQEVRDALHRVTMVE
jgi:hypothetical protein